MKLAEVTKKAIMIRDSNEREAQIDELSWLFERGFTKEDVIESVSILLAATCVEKVEQVKDVIFATLAHAMRYNDLSWDLQWDIVVAQLPDLSQESLGISLDILGYSRSVALISVLRPYAYDDRVPVQLSALYSLYQIYWEVSDHDPSVPVLMHIEEQRHISFLLGNPTQHNTPLSTIEAQVQHLRDEIIENLDKWVALQGIKE